MGKVPLRSNTISWIGSEAEFQSCGLRWSSSQQRNYSVSAHLRASTERVPRIPSPIIHLVFLTSGLFDSSGSNTVWNFTNSVFMNFGGDDAPLHPQFFSAVTFESKSLAEDSARLYRCMVGSRWQPLRPSSLRPASSDNFNIITLDHLLKNKSLTAVSRQSPTSALTFCHLDRLSQLAGLGRHESRQQRLSMGIHPSLWLLRDSRWHRTHVQLAWSVFGANLVVPLTWWTTIRKTFSTRWPTTVWTLS